MVEQKLNNGAKTPKPVEVKLPEKILAVINKKQKEKGQYLQQMLSVSFQVVELQKEQVALTDKIKNNNQTTRERVEQAFKKLKLKKRKNYRWSYNGRDTFVGRLIPEQPKKEEKK